MKRSNTVHHGTIASSRLTHYTSTPVMDLVGLLFFQHGTVICPRNHLTLTKSFDVDSAPFSRVFSAYGGGIRLIVDKVFIPRVTCH